MTKKWKTKWTVWGHLRTALNSEKKLQTAETEIYRLVMSNGTRDDFKVSIFISRVWVPGVVMTKVFSWHLEFFWFSCSSGFESYKIGLRKIVSTKILININFWQILSISIFWWCIYPDFWFSSNFRFWQFWFEKCWTASNIYLLCFNFNLSWSFLPQQ